MGKAELTAIITIHSSMAYYLVHVEAPRNAN